MTSGSRQSATTPFWFNFLKISLPLFSNLMDNWHPLPGGVFGVMISNGKSFSKKDK